MAVNFVDPEEQKTESEYHLICKVTVKDIAYTDVQSKTTESQTEKMVFLTPKSGSETDRFYDAWLPSGLITLPSGKVVGEEYFELTSKISYPVNGPCRLSVHRRDSRMLDHYLFVMTRAIEEDLKFMDGKFINVTILPSKSEAILDTTKDYVLNDNINR